MLPTSIACRLGADDFASLTTRGRFYMGCIEMRIARNTWLDLGYRRNFGGGRRRMSKTMNLQAVLFDFYNTLIEIRTDEGRDKVWERLARFLRYRQLEADPAHMRLAYFSRVENFKNDRPEEHAEIDVVDIFRQMLNEMGYRQESTSFPEELTQLFRTLSIVRFAPFPETFRCLEALHKRFKLGMVSDAQRPFFDPEVAMTLSA